MKGLELAQIFYQDGVKPVLDRSFPGLPYSAALIGSGSDVLGYDTPQSTDHAWGPRLMLFLSADDCKTRKSKINQVLRKELPTDIRGFPTNYRTHDDGTAVMSSEINGQINHRVMILAVQPYFRGILHFDPMGAIQPADWVSVPQNNLLMLTAGRVFHDGLNQLELIREKLSYYPRDVWLYLLSAQWQRISQEEHFMGRCGQVSDELGSKLIATRLVHDLMRLCFLIEQKHAPYIKWFGTAFSDLDCASNLKSIFNAVLVASSWEGRQKYLSDAYEFAAEMHNALYITNPLPTSVSPFHKRPFLVIHAEHFAEAIREEIKDEDVLALPKHLGGIDQFVNSTDAMNYNKRIKIVFSEFKPDH